MFIQIQNSNKLCAFYLNNINQFLVYKQNSKQFSQTISSEFYINLPYQQTTMDTQLLTIFLKIMFMLLFFIVVVWVGTLPIRSEAFKSNPKLRMIGSTFAGALFINVALLHILPESADTLQEWLKNGKDEEVFPLANLLMMVGFLITLFFTKIMSTHSHDIDHLHTQSEEGHAHDNHEQHHQHCEQNTKKQHQNYQGSQENHKLKQSLLSHDQTKKGKKLEKKKATLNQAYILTIAIYFHTIFEGIAIGVQTQISEFLAIAIAIAFHKWADALSMGCHYRAKHIPKKIAYVLIFGQAFLNVFSIGLGWILASSGDVQQAIFLSLSAGTFLAISTMELLSQQFHHKEHKYLKFLLLICATAFISCVWFVQNSIF